MTISTTGTMTPATLFCTLSISSPSLYRNVNIEYMQCENSILIPTLLYLLFSVCFMLHIVWSCRCCIGHDDAIIHFIIFIIIFLGVFKCRNFPVLSFPLFLFLLHFFFVVQYEKWLLKNGSNIYSTCIYSSERCQCNIRRKRGLSSLTFNFAIDVVVAVVICHRHR